MSEGIVKLFMGFGFLLVSFAVMLYAPAGRLWWYWLLIPAFGMMGKGVAEIVTANKREAQQAPPMTPGPQAHYQQPPGVAELPPRNTGPVFPPPSVTEQTTRHLDSTMKPPRE